MPFTTLTLDGLEGLSFEPLTELPPFASSLRRLGAFSRRSV
jgi:hypothetical protein